MSSRVLPALLLLALLAPLASSQGQDAPTRPAPRLLVEPGVLDLTAGNGTAGTAMLRLRHDGDVAARYQLGFDAPPGLRVAIVPAEITLEPGAVGEARVDVRDVGAPEGRHKIALLAHRAPASPDAAREPPLRAELGVLTAPRTGTPDAATPAGEGTLALDAASITLEPGGRASGTVRVRNTGTVPLLPELAARAPRGLSFTFAAMPALPPGGAAEVPYGVVAETGLAPGTHRVEIVALGFHAATAPLDVEVTGPPPSPAPVPAPDARVALLAGAAVATAGVWTAAWLTRRDWWPLLLALYTRLRPSTLLDHPLRAKLVEVVRAQPGISFGALARALDIAPGQLTHHARMLEKARILFSSPDGQTRRFYLVAEGRVDAVGPLAERALDLVRARPRRASEVARELGVSRQALHYHVKQLTARGALVARPDGRDVWLELPVGPEPQNAPGGVART